MKQYLIVVATFALFNVPALGETHTTNAYSLDIKPGLYRQDPNLFPDMNKPGAGLAVVGNEAFDTFKKGEEVQPGQPLS